MRRAIIMSCCLAGGLLSGSAATAGPGIDLQIDRAITRVADRGAPTQAGLMRRWVAVGKCVVGHDRLTSLAFVRAAVGSDDASEAARRLDPIFATCLAGVGRARAGEHRVAARGTRRRAGDRPAARLT